MIKKQYRHRDGDHRWGERHNILDRWALDGTMCHPVDGAVMSMGISGRYIWKDLVSSHDQTDNIDVTHT